MIYKYIFLCICLFLFAVASENKIQLTAKHFSIKDGRMTATGDINFTDSQYVINANKAKYDHNMTILEFDGNITINSNIKNIKLEADYIKTMLKKDYMYFKNFELIDTKKNIWLKSECSEKKYTIFYLTKTIVSACQNKQHPFWKIEFSKGEYDYIKETLDLNNVVFYVKSIPLTYLPFLSLQVGNKQKSGLLSPKFSFFGDKAYMQPLFFVLKDNIDIQFTPYIRINNGIGFYNKVRFIDSVHSQGSLSFGTFMKFDSSSFKQDNFYGLEFEYINELKSKDNIHTFLNIDTQIFNNVSYFNFKKLDTLDLKIDTTAESKIGYIYQYQDWEISTQIKNIQDIQKNTDIQLLPFVKVYKTRDFIYKNLSYDFEYSFEYLHRNKIDDFSTLLQEALLPYRYNVSIFDNYLDLSIVNETKIIKQDFYKEFSQRYSVTSMQNYIQLGISSKLAKSYNGIFHNIDMGINTRMITKDFASENFSLPAGDNDNIGIFLKQYLVKNSNTFLSHSIAQNIYKNKKTLSFDTIGDIKNYIKYEYKDLSFYNKSTYSVVKNELLYSSTNIEAKIKNTKIRVSHLFENNTKNSSNKYTNYMGGDININILKGLYIGANIQYDQNTKKAKTLVAKLSYDKDCWGYTLKVGKNNIPTFSENKTSFIENNNIIYFQIRFNPIGGLSHSYYFK